MYPILLVLLSALLFGASTPACKALLQELDPVQLAGWLYLGAAIGAAPGMLRRGQRQRVKRLDRKNKLRLLGAVSFGGVLGPIALLLGLRLASAASVSLWLNLELVATALLGYFFFRDHLGRFGWLGVVGVLIAGIILSLGGGASGVAAGLLVALACLFWGLDNHLTALIDGITPLQSTFYKGMVAGSFNLGLAFLLGASWPAPELALGGIMVGILAYGVSIALYITAAQQLGATRAQLVFASAPFFGAGLSAAVLGEPLGMAHLVAGVILVISLILLFQDQHEHEHTHEAMAHEHTHRHDDGHHTHEHPGMAPGQRHSHAHDHEPTTHRHPHWPDLHHRHAHGESEES